MKTRIDHADIVVTHRCTFNCPFCVDKFRNNLSYREDISLENVKKFLTKLRDHTEYIPSFGNEKLTVLLLGGEPTMLPTEDLKNIAKEIRSFEFSPHISTNGVDKDKIKSILSDFDWVQITVHSDEEIDYWSPYKSNINIKLSGDETLTWDKLIWWICRTKDYPRKSVSMYIKQNFEELCKDKDIWSLFEHLDFQRLGSYEYAFFENVRFKKCIKNVTNVIEEPLIPKLYPNGNYNKTWNNEILDNYIEGSW